MTRTIHGRGLATEIAVFKSKGYPANVFVDAQGNEEGGQQSGVKELDGSSVTSREPFAGGSAQELVALHENMYMRLLGRRA